MLQRIQRLTPAADIHPDLFAYQLHAQPVFIRIHFQLGRHTDATDDIQKEPLRFIDRVGQPFQLHSGLPPAKPSENTPGRLFQDPDPHLFPRHAKLLQPGFDRLFNRPSLGQHFSHCAVPS